MPPFEHSVTPTNIFTDSVREPDPDDRASSSGQPSTPSRDDAANASLDPFANLDRLRLSQDFSSLTSVKPVLTAIEVRKPKHHEFVRVRPGNEWRFETMCFTEKESGETYLVAPSMHVAMASEMRPTVLVIAINRNSPVPILWPIPLPDSDGRWNRWHESAFAAAKMAETQWLRVRSDTAASSYVPLVAKGTLDDPVWPDELTLQDLLRLGFEDKVIDTLQNPVFRRLRGEI